VRTVRRCWNGPADVEVSFEASGQMLGVNTNDSDVHLVVRLTEASLEKDKARLYADAR